MLDRIKDALKDSMKRRDADRTSALRMLLAEIGRVQATPAGAKSDAQQVTQTYAKGLRKSAEEYRKLGETARAEAIERELKVVEEFLPQRLSPEETAAAVERILREHSITEPKQMGQAMKLVMGELGGQVDGREVQALIKSRLGG